jgi:hypothetical protein
MWVGDSGGWNGCDLILHLEVDLLVRGVGMRKLGNQQFWGIHTQEEHLRRGQIDFS